MRYFIQLAYRGTPFVGWQRQLNGLSVQQCLEENLSKVVGEPLSLVGCGRTDAGVHASSYFAHFDLTQELDVKLVNRVNRILPDEISIKSIFKVEDSSHARFDATKRTYQYFISGVKNPFRQDLAYWYYGFQKLDRQKMVDAATLIRQHDTFLPFCKTNSDAKHYKCQIFESRWQEAPDLELVYTITANRFLRGMVRLIAGMCIQVGIGNMQLEEVALALKLQKSLSKPLSAPAQGLFLTDISYDFLESTMATHIVEKPPYIGLSRF